MGKPFEFFFLDALVFSVVDYLANALLLLSFPLSMTSGTLDASGLISSSVLAQDGWTPQF